MGIIDRDETSKLTIDLAGPEGNAFTLLGYASKFSKQLGKTEVETDEITKAMMSSDYENLIEVFDENFGEYVDLIKAK